MQHTDAGTPAAAATTDLPATLTAILSEHLSGQDVGPDDDFYALGGDSLIALRVVASAQQHGIAMTLKDLLYYPTVRELAAYLSSAQGEPPSVTAQPSAGPASDDGLLAAGDLALVPADVETALPASALQVGIIYLCETSGDPDLYHSVIGWETLAPFDEAVFRSALGRLCDRHAALRTSFDLGTFSEAVQLQWRHIELPLSIERLPESDPAKARELVGAWREHGLQLPLDWSHAPLFRCHVVAQPESFHVAIATHHAVVDGWSYGRLIVDLLELYAAGLKGEEARLPELPATGESDFIVAERALLASTEAADFWHQRADVPPLLFERGQFSGAANAVAKAEFPLGEEVLSGLRSAARTARTSLKSVALAAHVRALSAWTGRQEDLVTGVVVNTRPENAGSDLMVGLYLNTVPLRFASLDESWADLARHAFDLEREAGPYRGFPLAQIESRLERAPFDTVFNFMDFHVYQELPDTVGVETRSWWVRGKPSFPFRVDFEVDGTEAGSRVVVAYDPALLEADGVEQYARHFESALADAASRAVA
ncbi:condensation domain-containing protein [Streptomyces sp. NPDC001233]